MAPTIAGTSHCTATLQSLACLWGVLAIFLSLLVVSWCAAAATAWAAITPALLDFLPTLLPGLGTLVGMPGPGAGPGAAGVGGPAAGGTAGGGAGGGLSGMAGLEEMLGGMLGGAGKCSSAAPAPRAVQPCAAVPSPAQPSASAVSRPPPPLCIFDTPTPRFRPTMPQGLERWVVKPARGLVPAAAPQASLCSGAGLGASCAAGYPVMHPPSLNGDPWLLYRGGGLRV